MRERENKWAVRFVFIILYMWFRRKGAAMSGRGAEVRKTSSRRLEIAAHLGIGSGAERRD